MGEETDIYLWTDRQERTYVQLRRRGRHWQLEWGSRDPPGGPNYVQQGEHQSSVREEMVGLLLDRVRALSDEPDEVTKVERHLRQHLQEARRATRG